MPLDCTFEISPNGKFYLLYILPHTQKTVETSASILEILSLERAAFKTQCQGTAAPNPLAPEVMGSVSYRAVAIVIWLGRAGAGVTMSHAQTQCRLCRDNAGCVLATGPLASPVLAFLCLLSLGAHSLARFMPVSSPGFLQTTLPILLVQDTLPLKAADKVGALGFPTRGVGRFGQRVPKASPPC